MAAVAERAPSVRERKLAPFFRRFIAAIEPWYNWGSIDVERMQEIRLDDGGRIQAGGEGPVRYFEIQWLGIHFQLQIGRTPKALHAPALRGQAAIAKRIIQLREDAPGGVA